MRYNAHLDMSHGQPREFKHAGVVADSPTGIRNAIVMREERCMHKVSGVPARVQTAQ
jgi:hypothetical protein